MSDRVSIAYQKEGGAHAFCDQIRTIDKSRIGELIGSISEADMNSLEEGLRQVLVL